MATTPDDQSNLKGLFREAGLKYQTVDRERVEVVLGGPYRPWTIVASLSEHWLSLSTTVCRVPELPGQKAELSELLMRLNDEIVLAKYARRGGSVVLELEYRAEHVNADTMHGLVTLISTCADGQYPRVFRVVTGDETLARLGKQFAAIPPPDPDRHPSDDGRR